MQNEPKQISYKHKMPQGTEAFTWLLIQFPIVSNRRPGT